MSVLASAGIFATTIQAQDFKDTEGDRLVGRKTLPIVAPTIARPTLMLALMLWSVGLSALWGLSTWSALAFNVLAFTVGMRFVSLDSIKADQRSFYLYNVGVRAALRRNSLRLTSFPISQVWLSAAHALPAYFRLIAQTPLS